MQVLLDPQSMPLIPGSRIAVLQAKWYREYVDKMVQKCVELLRHAQCETLEHHILPGSLELPLAAQHLLRSAPPERRFDAVICFGAIMKGETMHFEMIVDECMRGLGQVMLSEGVPIIVEVIPVMNVDQLAERSRDDQFNKGIEAALAAAEIITWRNKVKPRI